jgi:hypothetical protein
MNYPYYPIWTGSISLGDTPGVFMDSQYAGLLVQIPFTINFPEPPNTVDVVTILLTTTEVEIFADSNGNKLVHKVYLNWQPGTALPPAVGVIDDQVIFAGQPEINQINIPGSSFGNAVAGRHTLTIQVNPNTNAGLRDDFVLKRIEISENVGARIGW